jgi:hypothetical protein
VRGADPALEDDPTEGGGRGSPGISSGRSPPAPAAAAEEFGGSEAEAEAEAVTCGPIFPGPVAINFFCWSSEVNGLAVSTIAQIICLCSPALLLLLLSFFFSFYLRFWFLPF